MVFIYRVAEIARINFECFVIILSVLLFVLTTLVLYLLVWRIFDHNVALLAINILALAPPILPRTYAGFADRECLTCHTVGFGFQTGFVTIETTSNLPDVGCENCHGVGGNHVENPWKGYGQVTKANCLTCHTTQNSPNFDYDVYLPTIRHWSDMGENDETAKGF